LPTGKVSLILQNFKNNQCVGVLLKKSLCLKMVVFVGFSKDRISLGTVVQAVVQVVVQASGLKYAA
jgi:hypothetical protein